MIKWTKLEIEEQFVPMLVVIIRPAVMGEMVMWWLGITVTGLNINQMFSIKYLGRNSRAKLSGLWGDCPPSQRQRPTISAWSKSILVMVLPTCSDNGQLGRIWVATVVVISSGLCGARWWQVWMSGMSLDKTITDTWNLSPSSLSLTTASRLISGPQ